jgi:hypothetical protein
MRHIAAGIYRRREMLAPNSPRKAQAFATLFFSQHQQRSYENYHRKSRHAQIAHWALKMLFKHKAFLLVQRDINLRFSLLWNPHSKRNAAVILFPRSTNSDLMKTIIEKAGTHELHIGFKNVI